MSTHASVHARGRRAHPDPLLSELLLAVAAPRRRDDALALRLRPRRGEQPQQRLPVGHLDRVRRGHGTALGCGGYAVALLVYILNKGEYHPLVRPAVLTSLLGYGLAVLAVTVDLGRFWELWKVPVFFWRWSHSPQLEVALCVAAYVFVLLVELSPAFFEKWRTEPRHGPAVLRREGPRASSTRTSSGSWRSGILLPTMHQSSLGTMMLLPGPKLHPLWFTPWLPFLFLVNCVLMGYGVVVCEATLRGLRLRPPARDRDARPALEGRDGRRRSSSWPSALVDVALRGPARAALLLARRRGPRRARRCSWPAPSS